MHHERNLKNRQGGSRTTLYGPKVVSWSSGSKQMQFILKSWNLPSSISKSTYILAPVHVFPPRKHLLPLSSFMQIIISKRFSRWWDVLLAVTTQINNSPARFQSNRSRIGVVSLGDNKTTKKTKQERRAWWCTTRQWSDVPSIRACEICSQFCTFRFRKQFLKSPPATAKTFVYTINSTNCSRDISSSDQKIAKLPTSQVRPRQSPLKKFDNFKKSNPNIEVPTEKNHSRRSLDHVSWRWDECHPNEKLIL